MAFPTTGVLDNFNRSDEGPPPSASWTDIDVGIAVVSNEAQGTTINTSNISGWNVETFGPNAEAYCTLQGDNTGVCTRLTTLVEATHDGYKAYHSSSNKMRIYRIDNNARTQLGAEVAHTVAAGDKIGLESVGTTHTYYLDDGGAGWASQFSRTDATYGAAGYIGLWIWSTTNEADDFGGGTIAAAGGQPTNLRAITVPHLRQWQPRVAS